MFCSIEQCASEFVMMRTVSSCLAYFHVSLGAPLVFLAVPHAEALIANAQEDAAPMIR